VGEEVKEIDVADERVEELLDAPSWAQNCLAEMVGRPLTSRVAAGA
jgi:hypothetical protein